jgi:hypothetical protein
LFIQIQRHPALPTQGIFSSTSCNPNEATSPFSLRHLESGSGMDTDLPVTLSPAFLKVTRIRGQACPRVCAPNLPRSATPSSSGRWATRAARSALRVVPAAGTVPAPLPPRALRPAPGPPRSAPLAPPLRRAVQSLGSSGGSRGSSRSPSGLHGNAASQARNSEPTASAERGWPSWSALRGNNLAGRPEGKQQCGDCE